MFNFENFVTIDYILSFPGMVVLVVLFTQGTKSLADKIADNKTKYVVLFWAVFFAVFGALWNGGFSTVREIAETCLVWLANAFIVWFASRKAYEDIVERKQ